MAEALVNWARKRLKEIAQYQYESFQMQSATVDFRIAIKEIFDHLRSALDYCAREICENVPGAASEVKLYFPIAPIGFDEKDFRSLVGKCLPGLLVLCHP
jgi:hypothetical protein